MSTVRACDRCGAELGRYGPSRECRLNIGPGRKHVVVTVQPVSPGEASASRPLPDSYELCTDCGSKLKNWLLPLPSEEPVAR